MNILIINVLKMADKNTKTEDIRELPYNLRWKTG